MSLGQGLTNVSNDDLKRLLQVVHRAELSFPLRRAELLAMGLNNLADHADLLVGLNARGAQAVIAAVLAERRVRAG